MMQQFKKKQLIKLQFHPTLLKVRKPFVLSEVLDQFNEYYQYITPDSHSHEKVFFENFMEFLIDNEYVKEAKTSLVELSLELKPEKHQNSYLYMRDHVNDDLSAVRLYVETDADNVKRWSVA